MSNLATFLETANEDDLIALDEARAHEENQGVLLPATTVNQLLAAFGLLEIVWDIQNNTEHVNKSVRSSCIALLLSINGNHEFNFIHGKTAGEGNKQILDMMIAEGERELDEVPTYKTLADYVPQLLQFKDMVLWLANKVVYPFANTTLHEVKVVRNSFTEDDYMTVTSDDGYVVIEVLTECELHNPRLQAFNPHTEQWVAAGHIRGVGAVGKYSTQVPRHVFGWELRVDDVYGVFA